MARLNTSQATNGMRVSFDDTLPFKCVIESSQLVEGHGVMTKMKFYLFDESSILKLGIFDSCISSFE